MTTGNVKTTIIKYFSFVFPSFHKNCKYWDSVLEIQTDNTKMLKVIFNVIVNKQQWDTNDAKSMIVATITKHK